MAACYFAFWGCGKMIWYTYEINDGETSHHFETLANDVFAALETVAQHVELWQLEKRPFAWVKFTHENAVGN